MYYEHFASTACLIYCFYEENIFANQKSNWTACKHVIMLTNQTDELESMFLMFLGKKHTKGLWSYILEKNCGENKGTQNTLRTFWKWEKKGS